MTFTIPSGSFKVPILNRGFQAYGALTVNVELDLSLKGSEILAMNGHLSPVATAKYSSNPILYLNGRHKVSTLF